MKKNVALEEAQRFAAKTGGAGGECQIALLDAVGRVLSRDIEAPFNLPPFDRSPLDGYAVRAQDIRSGFGG
jgi:molybdopterin molybdotransferase